MKNLKELKKELLSDGIIDAGEVLEIREIIYADGKIDSEEADFLFEINDAVSGKNNDSSWTTLFIEAITSYLLEDENSPGEIDDDEATWLFDKINGDGQIDEIEKQLLLNIKSKVDTLQSNLESLL
jgi:hypothetical protein|tara:strand:- start:253 stop:630 length:378 start_codon:yes stop_codon:yes gene_type:complete